MVEQAHFIERQNCINCGSGHLKEISHGKYWDEPLRGFLAADPWGEQPLPFLKDSIWSLIRCEACSQLFHRYILDEEWNERRFSKWMSVDALKEFEDRVGPSYDRTFSHALHHVEHVMRIASLTKARPIRLLDFGCGSGEFLESCNLFGIDAVGVDRSIGRRSVARVTIHSSLDQLRGRTFDAITLFEVLEHLDNPAQILAELFHFMKPNGILVLETPDCSGVSDIKTLSGYRKLHPLDHINAFTHATLKSIAERQGFKMIDRPATVVTTGILKTVKRLARVTIKDGKSTQLYFRRAR